MSVQQQPPQQQQANPLRFAPDANILGQLFPEPQQQQALAQLFQAFNNHTLSITQRLLVAQEEAYGQRLAPLETYHQQQEVDGFYRELGSKYPELADHMDTVKQLQITLPQGDNLTREDILKSYAEGARGHLSKYVPALATPSPDGVPATSQPPTMPTPGQTPKTSVNPPQPSATSPTRPVTPPAPTAPTTSSTQQTLDASAVAGLFA